MREFKEKEDYRTVRTYDCRKGSNGNFIPGQE
jgi:hypothetical protein